jgi:hypothetical protein
MLLLFWNPNAKQAEERQADTQTHRHTGTQAHKHVGTRARRHAGTPAHHAAKQKQNSARI